MKKKVISLALTMCLVVTCFASFSLTAFASVNTKVISGSVYGGPSTATYTKIGSVGNEAFTAEWKEGSYIYGSYKVDGTNYRKAGYVWSTLVSNTNVPTKSFSKSARYSTAAQNVYGHWEYLNSCTKIGSISTNEKVSVLKTRNGKSFIEYKITGTSQLKRGWVPSNKLSDKPIAKAIRYGDETSRLVASE